MPFHQIKNDEGKGALYYELFNDPFDSTKETVLLLPSKSRAPGLDMLRGAANTDMQRSWVT